MSDASPRVLIAGVGNVLLGDDAFGVEAARRLAESPPPGNVRIAEFGIRGIHLACEMMEGYDLVILLDLVARGGPPGTLYVFAPAAGGEAGDAEGGTDGDAEGSSPCPTLDAHDLDPAQVLRTVTAMGGQPGRMLLVGCEPSPMAGDADIALGLTPPVRDAVDQAVELTRQLVAGAAPCQGPPAAEPSKRPHPLAAERS